jgi:DNA polymerase
MESLQHPQQILSWYLNAGVDEAIGEQPLDRYALATQAMALRQAEAEKVLQASEAERADRAPKASSRQNIGPVSVQPVDHGASEDAIKTAVQVVRKCQTIEDLRTALDTFDGCALKKNAMNLVFADGPTDAKVMLIGDVPGEREDRQGAPFVGPDGQLLNKMLASIGVDRSEVFVSNSVFWRPAGNRSPLPSEIAVCLPFVERMIEIVDPQILITLGGPASHSLLAQQGNISKLVGRWFTYETPQMSHPIVACALYHPRNLINTPTMKRQAWANLLAIKDKIAELA